jgi:hypothetical protein
VVFAAPKFVKTETIKVGRKVKIALELQNWIFSDRVVRSQESTEFQTVGPTAGI